MKHKDKEKPNTEDSQQAPAKEPKHKKDDMETLHAELENLQKEKDELFGKLQRVSADYANFQKRSAKQIADAITYEKEMIIKTLLPVLDNFEHTIQNIQTAENMDVLIKGVKIIHDQMLDILKLHGVEQTKSTNEKFDPNLHEAMLQKADPDKEDNIVLEEFQKGYKLNGRVIRPSKVIVNKLPTWQKEQDQKEQTEQTNTEDEITDTQ